MTVLFYFRREVDPAEEEVKPKKALRSEATDRWGHDLFDQEQQGPKSKDELVGLYGYDIRQEEGAPRFIVFPFKHFDYHSLCSTVRKSNLLWSWTFNGL